MNNYTNGQKTFEITRSILLTIKETSNKTMSYPHSEWQKLKGYLRLESGWREGFCWRSAVEAI